MVPRPRCADGLASPADCGREHNHPSKERAMKTFATLAVAIALGAGSISTASADTAIVSKTVKYGDLDINGPKGAKTLYNRIKAAAESLCSPVDGRLLVQQH